MSGEGDDIRIAELTAESQKNSKPIKLSKTKTKLVDLIKEGKNKFRKKYKFVVYCHSSSSSPGDGEDQYIYTDEDLCRVLQLHEGKLRFRLTNTAPTCSGNDKPMNIVQRSGVDNIIGNEEDTESNAIDIPIGTQQLGEGCEQEECYASHLSATVDGSDLSQDEAKKLSTTYIVEEDQLASEVEKTLVVDMNSCEAGKEDATEIALPVLFWRDGDSHSYLSNWHKSPITIDGNTFTCVEQYYMWYKADLFEDQKIAKCILSTTNPSKMKKLGREVRGFKPAKWRKHQPIVLLEGNRAKFRENPELAKRLLSTGNRPIAEASPSDSICGIGLGPLDPRAKDPKQWRGLNLLGKALEKVREELRDRDACNKVDDES